MSATSVVKKWDSPEKTRVSGLPPGPDATIEHTARGEFRRQDIHAINPYYKTDPSSQTQNGGVGLHISRETKIEPKQFTGTPDYKVEKEQESYRLNIIDPKVTPHSTSFSRSSTLPAYFRKQPKSTDFPSAHSKRSFLKVDPLEPRRLRSLETKNIKPHDYLSESLERHRAVSMSPLRENLKVNEKDVNQPWNAAPRPGPKLREIVQESSFQKTEESFGRGKAQNGIRMRHYNKLDEDKKYPAKFPVLEAQIVHTPWENGVTFLKNRFKKSLNNHGQYKLQNADLVEKVIVQREKYFPVKETKRCLSSSTDETKTNVTKITTMRPMEPVSELEISKHTHEQKSDSAYSSQVTTAERTPAHSHQSKQNDSPKKIWFEGRHPPSSYIGLYTQLDLPPQRTVFENQPVQSDVDAKSGPGNDVVPAKVNYLREVFQGRVEDGVIKKTEVIVADLNQFVPVERESRQIQFYPTTDSTKILDGGTQQQTRDQYLKSEQIRIEHELMELEKIRRAKEMQLSQHALQMEQQNLELKRREQQQEQLSLLEQRKLAEEEQQKLFEQEQQKIIDERKRAEQQKQFEYEQSQMQLQLGELQRQKDEYGRQRRALEQQQFATLDQYRPPPTDTASWQYTTSNNFSPRSVVSINGHYSPSKIQSYTTEQIRTTQQPYWQIPAVLIPVAGTLPMGTMAYELKEESKSNTEFESRRPRYYEDEGSKHSTMINVKDLNARHKRNVKKETQKENWESHRHETNTNLPVRPHVVHKTGEQVLTTEETKRTEEVERRVVASDKKSKHKKLGGHNRSYITHTVKTRTPRPAVEYEQFDEQRQRTVTHQSGDSHYRDGGSYSTRRGDHYRGRDDQFYTNGDTRQREVRKTHSSRDVYGNQDDYYATSPRPIIEYPPTLPRSEDHYGQRGVRRSNSMNDWSLQPRYYQDPGLMNRYGETGGLEREFRDSLLMPLPRGQNVNEKEYREERIPGGLESFSREVKAQTGSRHDHPNATTHFSESKQEVNFKREQTFDR